MRTRFIFSLLFMTSTCIGLHAQIVVDSIGCCINRVMLQQIYPMAESL